MRASWVLILILGSVRCHEKRQSKGRTQTPLGCLAVGKSAQYKTLDSALRSLGSGTKPACIFMQSGNYTDQTIISYKGPLSIYGSTTNTGDYKSNIVTFAHRLSSPNTGSLGKSAALNIISGIVKRLAALA